MTDRRAKPDVEDLLGRASRAMANDAPLASQVRARLHEVSMSPRNRYGRTLVVIGAGALLVVMALTWQVLRVGGSDTTVRVAPSPAPREEPAHAMASATFGEVSIAQELALIVDSRTVLVLWSWTGENTRAESDGVAMSPRRRGNYTEWPLVSGTDLAGTAWQWSLFIADPGVLVIAAPPAVGVHRLERTRLRLAVTPRPCASSQLQQVIDGAAGPDRAAPSVKELEKIMAGHAGSSKGEHS